MFIKGCDTITNQKCIKKKVRLETASKIVSDEIANNSFSRPVIISFLGLPGSGKSTIAKKLHQNFPSNLYLEKEETDYPEKVLYCFRNQDIKNSSLYYFNYFRKQRLQGLYLAQKNKLNGQSSIIDSYYDKIFAKLFGHPGMDYLINSKHEDFPKIATIAENDYLNLPNPDFLFFFKLSNKELYKTFLNSRKRETEVNDCIFSLQDHFIKAVIEYGEKNSVITYIIDQEFSLDSLSTIQKITKCLDDHGLIIRKNLSVEPLKPNASNIIIKPIQSIYNQLRNGESLNEDDFISIIEGNHTIPQLVSLIVKLSFKKINSVEEKLINYLRKLDSEISEYISLYFENKTNSNEKHFSTLKSLKNNEFISEFEIKNVLDLYNNKKINDNFMSAFLATIFHQGLSTENTMAMSYYMRDSGKIYDYRNSKELEYRKIIRRYPTGGLSEKIALIMPSIISSLAEQYPIASNFLVAKTLSYTGGTWDKLSCISEFKFPTQGIEAIDIMRKSFVAMSVTNEDFNPLDRRLYQLRGSTGSVESIPLLVSSIASKQLGIPADFLLMDVRYGTGAFLKTQNEAHEFSSLLMKILGKEMNADYLLTEASQPTGMSVGNILELIEAIYVLNNGLGHSDLWDKRALLEQKKLSVSMMSKMMNFILPNNSRNYYEQEIENLFINGKILESFKKLLINHSVGEETAKKIIENPEHLIEKYAQYNIFSQCNGKINFIDQESLGTFVNFELQTGLNEFTIKKDFGAGVILKVRLGDYVLKGQPVCTLIANEGYIRKNENFLQNYIASFFKYIN